MNGRFKIFILLLVAPLFLVSCGSQAPQDEWKPKRAKVKRPDAANARLAGEKAAKIKAMEKEMISKGPEGNPFLSDIIIRKAAESDEQLKGPLECCAISLFRLLAVVVGSDSSYALVQAPDGKRYIVRKDDRIGTRGGKVIKIDGTGLIIRENNYSVSGKVVSASDTVLMLPVSK